MFKQLMKYIGEYKKYFILAPLLVVGEAIAELLLPYCMGRIVDVGVATGNVPYMFLMGGLMILIAIGGILTGYRNIGDRNFIINQCKSRDGKHQGKHTDHQ